MRQAAFSTSFPLPPHSESDFQFNEDGIVIYAASSCMDVKKC